MTLRPVGLAGPIAALLGFALLFNPLFLPHLPKRGIASMLVSPQLFFLLAAAAIALRRRLRPADIGLLRSRIGHQLALGAALSAGPALLTAGIGGLLMLLDRLRPFLPRPLLGGDSLAVRFDGTDLFLLLFLAPVAEEIFFRGILLRALREAYSPLLAVLLSALIFMGGHGGLAIGPFLLGLVTAPVALATGSILPGMIFHAVCNGYGPLLTRWFPNLYRYLDFFFQ